MVWDLARWGAFLALPDPAPSWRYWSQIVAYGLRFLEWVDSRADREATDSAIGAFWRTLTEENEPVGAGERRGGLVSPDHMAAPRTASASGD